MKTTSQNHQASSIKLCNSEESLLLVIDIQQRLTTAMPDDQSQRMLRNTQILLQSAALLKIPVLATEQYPKGLGSTHKELQQHFTTNTLVFEKTDFSCCAANGFMNALLESARTQIIISGIETHICVLQTALQLKAKGFSVFVVEDATCSRLERHHANALARMQQHNIEITNHESVLFEWLGDAAHPDFKFLSSLIR
ncbi:MAG: isochorismatase family protein [Methylococcales bacterium]